MLMRFPHSLGMLFCSINAVGVDIAPFSAMPDEEEVLLLPGLPLVNRPGENEETDFWSFEIETPSASTMKEDSPDAMIDFVHPGTVPVCPCPMLYTSY